ncbi:AmmeMemoRadiSam system radical SAM enzyme [Candidatus Bathyarchaeota archaeon]|jgi:pyruvate formate lyase activating enzyme|nr:MAG: AmmeMemoRadiSam system radical SAM enzyme [Candidatus Bathyarchaeota archaeon]
MESRFVEKLNNALRCTICPHQCVLAVGKRGVCGTKENQGGKIIDLSYGRLSALAVDPIEKKPLVHFYPGSKALSISSIGCNFTCPWCQNFELSQSKIDEVHTRYMEPESVVEIALAQDCTSIAYTYNEPLINLNYIIDTAKFAHESGVKNVLVTNGYTSIPAFSHAVEYIDAANVDWKSFSTEFYRKHCNADFFKVLESTQYMHEHGVHVEITFLIIPETNDDPEEVRAMARHIVNNMGPDVPLHLSKFFPMYKFQNLPPTPVETLMNAKKIAQEEGLHYVFVGNVRSGGEEDTVCPSCGQHVIKRSGYTVTGWDLSKEMNCSKCGAHIPIIGEYERHTGA